MPQLLTLLRVGPWVAILLLLAWSARLNDLRDRWQHHYAAEHAGRIADRATYTAAQKQAQLDNLKQVQATEEKWKRNSDNARQAYLDDLARLRGMRSQPPAAPGSAGHSGASAAPATAGGAHADGLPLPAPDDVQQAAEIELRLMHLQNWVQEQLGVDPNR